MSKYKHLFFDLDRTLWDFNTNSEAALTQMYKEFELQQYGFGDSYKFIKHYKYINRMMWGLYREGKVTKEVLRYARFHNVLKERGTNDLELAKKMGEFYLEVSPHQTTLMPGAIECLEALKDDFVLHMITNGFSETQMLKLEKTNMKKYFVSITTSEEAGVLKPKPEIFEVALKKAGAKKEESIYIGDDWEVDVNGAKNAGIDQAFYNPFDHRKRGSCTVMVGSLEELVGWVKGV